MTEQEQIEEFRRALNSGKAPAAAKEPAAINTADDGGMADAGTPAPADQAAIEGDGTTENTGEVDLGAKPAGEIELPKTPEGAADEAPVAGADGKMAPEEAQQERSWRGRLEAREAALKAREDSLKAREASMQNGAGEVPAVAIMVGEGEDPDQARGKAAFDKAQEKTGELGEAQTATDAEAREDLIESLRGDAMRMLASGELATKLEEAREVYGQEFLALAAALGAMMHGPMTRDAMSEYDTRLKDMDGGIRGAFAQLHRNMIADQHEDYEDVGTSEGFQAWVAGLPDGERESAEQVLKSGTAGQVTRLLGRYKQSMASSENDDYADDGAMGVSSSGAVKIPSRPAAMSPDDEFRAALRRYGV